MYEEGKINALEKINGIVSCLQRIKKVNAHMEENQCWIYSVTGYANRKQGILLNGIFFA